MIRTPNRRHAILEVVISSIFEVVGVTVEADSPLMDAGVDSRSGMEVRRQLNSKLGGLSLPPTALLDYPTPRKLAQFMDTSLYPTATPLAAEVVRFVVTDAAQACAVVGMSCYTPGGCRSPQELWQLLCSGRDCVMKIPVSRFDVDALDGTPDALYVKHGHFVDGVELFDNAYFGISKSESSAMDPHQRLLMEVGYQALAGAGHDKTSLMGSLTGVFLGFCHVLDWAFVQRDRGVKATPLTGLGQDAAGAAGRVSYMLGLKGPCITVNTACSSSMVAFDSAIQETAQL